MRGLVCASLFMAAGMAAAVPALAELPGDQTFPVTASSPLPDTSREAPGIPGPDAVNPAPGAQGPYVGAGKDGFYDIDQRISTVGQAIGALPAGQRRRAASRLHAIQSEERFKRAKYKGVLRDWDREHLTAMLDHLVQQYPSLEADGGMTPAPAP